MDNAWTPPPPDRVAPVVGAWRDRFPAADLAGLELNRRIYLAQRAVQSYAAAALAGSGFELWEWDVVFVLWRAAPEEMAMGDLGVQLFITAGSVTNRVRHLEERGLVQRRRDPEVRRRVLASLTPTGQRTADEVAPLMAAASTHATAQLAARGLDVPALNRALALVADPLDPPPTPEENP